MSARARERDFAALTENEVNRIEAIYRGDFEPAIGEN